MNFTLGRLPRAKAVWWIVVAATVVISVVLYSLAWQRYQTFHNETFDLALYGRMAWGFVRGRFWDPVTNANAFGVHVMPVLFPLGLLGELLGTVRTLLAAQALALAATAIPLFVIARRQLGLAGGLGIAALWWTYPHIFHVGTYEFHPGSLGMFFLSCACMLEGGERDGRGGHKAIEQTWRKRVWWACLLLAIGCREDIALAAACLVLLRSRSRAHITFAAGSIAYFLLFSLVLVPSLGPTKNSVVLHFGQWGESLPEIVLHLFTHPTELWGYVFADERTEYLAQLFGCLMFLPLLGPRWLVPALPFLAMNLVSAWPSAIELDSHYQTLILPFLFLATIDGLVRVRAWSRGTMFVLLALALCTATWAHLYCGGSRAAADFDATDFQEDDRSRAAHRIVERVPAETSVQAPYALMPHLLRRGWIAPAPPPDRNFDHVILDLSLRKAYRGKDTILRTDEEPIMRAWLGRDDYGIVHFADPYALVKRGAQARVWAREQGYILKNKSAGKGQRLTSCLRLLDVGLEGSSVELRLAADQPCPKDLAVRLGDTYRPERVDLLFDGLLNPAQLQAGDVARSVHRLTPEEKSGVLDTGICVGAVRQSGVRPEKSDPVSVCLGVDR